MKRYVGWVVFNAKTLWRVENQRQGAFVRSATSQKAIIRS